MTLKQVSRLGQTYPVGKHSPSRCEWSSDCAHCGETDPEGILQQVTVRTVPPASELNERVAFAAVSSIAPFSPKERTCFLACVGAECCSN